MDRDDCVHLIRLIVVGVARRIDNGVEKTFRDIKPMHQVGAFLDIGCDKWQIFLQFRIALARRSDRKIEQLLRWFGSVALEDDRA